MIGIDHPVLAYCFDEAVGLYGNWVESRMAERREDGSPMYRVETILGLPLRTRKITDDDIISLMGSG